MRRAALLLVLLATTALADDPARLPFSPFKEAQKGDWAFYGVEMREGAERKGDPFVRGSQTWDVQSVSSDSVTLTKAHRFATRVLRPKEEKPTFTLSELPALTDYLGLDDPSASVEDLATTDDKKTVQGRAFECKKLTFKVSNGTKKDDYTAWVSPALRGSGLVALEVIVHEAKRDVRIDVELLAHGTGEKTELGSVAEIWLVPVNIGKTAAAGDWTAFKASAKTAKKTDEGVEVWRVEPGAGDQLVLSVGGKKVPLRKERSPSLHDLIGARGELENLKVAAEERTVLDTKFACTVVDADTKKGHLTLVLSPSVKGSGVLSVKISGPQGSVELEAAGFGSKEKTEWGKSESELKK